MNIPKKYQTSIKIVKPPHSLGGYSFFKVLGGLQPMATRGMNFAGAVVSASLIYNAPQQCLYF